MSTFLQWHAVSIIMVCIISTTCRNCFKSIYLKLQGKQMKVAFATLDHDIDHGLGFSMQSACTCVN